MRAYEALLILPAEADERLVTTAVDRITKAIEPSGGSVLGIDRWGRRRFAFEIDRRSEGYYALVSFDAEPADIAPLERALVLADEVVRAKVTIRYPKRAASDDDGSTGTRPAGASRPQAAPAADAQDASSPTAPETGREEPSPAPA